MKKVLNIISVLFILASPWVLYWTLSQGDVAVAAITLVAWVIVRTIPVLLMAKREQRLAALQLPAIALVFALLGWISNNGTWLLILPSANQAAFGLAFLRSLRGTPLIEHFARMMKAELGPGQLAHCRRWTAVWGIYLLVLAALGLVLARFATLEVWTVYVGILSYVLVGVLFAIEYIVRKISFREYGRNPLDWLLSRVFPPARSDDAELPSTSQR
ncbi:membrane protein [soil metagenome]